MAKKNTAPLKVESIHHRDKRANTHFIQVAGRMGIFCCRARVYAIFSVLDCAAHH